MLDVLLALHLNTLILATSSQEPPKPEGHPAESTVVPIPPKKKPAHPSIAVPEEAPKATEESEEGLNLE